jgi:hypothetical protein
LFNATTYETVDKISGQNKTYENNNYRCVDLGERTKGNWRETQSMEPYYKRIRTENEHGQMVTEFHGTFIQTSE